MSLNGCFLTTKADLGDSKGFATNGEWKNSQVTAFVEDVHEEVQFTLLSTTPAQTAPPDGIRVNVKSVEGIPSMIYATWDSTAPVVGP